MKQIISIRNEIEYLTIHPQNIKRIIMNDYLHKLKNLDEMNLFLENHKLLKLTQNKNSTQILNRKDESRTRA